ncbi:MAG: PrsW family intramembrane metalloprotease [Patescibacteria group bacterium]|nr:PrsW family intramembrane metalloprotease [Patescibacteria group bacterium]MDE2438011.1 PrsW family intramembrane metalloprotease [Patescibacteria group bacterium]
MELLTALILGSAPAIGWLYFYLKEDIHPEPWKKLLRTFISGIAAAPIVLILENIFSKPLFSFDPSWTLFYAFLIAALIEEGFKFLAALPMKHDKEFDEPIDAMIYMITASLGFATAENIVLVLREIHNPLSPINWFAFANISLSSTIQLLSIRFMGATLLHTLASGLLGYYWAQSMQTHKTRYLIFGFFTAIGLHTAFNYLIIYYGNVSFLYTTSLLIVAGFFLLNDFELLKGNLTNSQERV